MKIINLAKILTHLVYIIKMNDDDHFLIYFKFNIFFRLLQRYFFNCYKIIKAILMNTLFNLKYGESYIILGIF